MEESASTPEKMIEMQQYAMQIQESPPQQERLELIQKLDSATKGTDAGVEVAMNTQMAVAIAIVASLPREQQPTYDQIVSMVEKNRPQMENLIQAQTTVFSLFAYEKASNAEIAQYLSFASSSLLATSTDFSFLLTSSLSGMQATGTAR